MEKIIAIKGMSCDQCVMSVTTALKKLVGVTEVMVSLAEQRARVIYDENSVNEPQLHQAIEEIGFEVDHSSSACTRG